MSEIATTPQDRARVRAEAWTADRLGPELLDRLEIALNTPDSRTIVFVHDVRAILKAAGRETP